MKNYTHKSEYFYGNKISNYGLEHGFVDYATLSKSFEGILCNDITRLFYSEINGEYNEVELVNGCDYDAESYNNTEIYQYYIIDNNGAEILIELTDEIVYYIGYLDLYVWGVTHYGTSWAYVLTDIKVDLSEG